MASWQEVEVEAPELAARARALFDAFVHKTIATLKRDGSPRISGTEVQFAEGELWIGSMWRALKALDLQRDPEVRVAQWIGQSADWAGDAKIAGRMVEDTDPDHVKERNGEAGGPGGSHLFRADIDELVVVYLGDPADHLVIESWHPGRGVTRERR